MTVGEFLEWLKDNDVPSKAVICFANCGYPREYQTFDSDQLEYDEGDRMVDITFPVEFLPIEP